jgi:hypothetical protein
LVAWFGIGVILAGVVTIDAPYAPRLIVAVPAVYLMGGVFLQNIYELFMRFWPASSLSSHGGWHSQQIRLAAAGAMAAATLYLNFNAYFVVYKEQRPHLAQVSIAQEMAEAAEGYRSYLLGAPNLYVRHGTIRLIAIEAEKYDLEKPEQLTAILVDHPKSKGALFIALPHRIDDLEQIAGQFPNGTKTEHQDARGKLLYLTYQLSAEDVAKQGN